MRTLRTILLAMMLLFASAIAVTAHAALAIVTHPSNPVSGLTVDEVDRIFLGKTGEFANGQRATPVDQVAGSPSRNKFLKSVLKRGEDELKAYWSKLQFSGKGNPPREVADDAAVKAFVSTTPGAIGYVDGKFVDGSVKVLLILP